MKREVSTCEPGDTMKRLKKGRKTRNQDLNSVGIKKKTKRPHADGNFDSLEPVETPIQNALQTLPSKPTIIMPPVLPDRQIETPKTIMRAIRNS